MLCTLCTHAGANASDQCNNRNPPPFPPPLHSTQVRDRDGRLPMNDFSVKVPWADEVRTSANPTTHIASRTAGVWGCGAHVHECLFSYR